MRFIGRKQELERLEQLLKKKIAQLIVIRGRRRVGKSRLAEQFGKNFSQLLIFSGLAPQKGINAKTQREEFSIQMAKLFNIATPQSDDWGELFRTLAHLIERKQTLLVLDEITWMGGKDPAFLSKLKSVWDSHFKKNSKLVLILSGSISSWIEKNILSSSGFIGRISLDLILTPLTLSDCNQFWGKQKNQVSSYEKFKFLSVTGGIPRYLEELVPTESAEANIQQLCFHQGSLLYREFENIFSDLFAKRSSSYQNIVRILAEGPQSIEDICKKLKIHKTGTMSSYLNDLITSGFVSRDYTWRLKTGKISKLSRFRLRDNYARFFLKYIEPNKIKIDSGAYRIPRSWETIMGLQFENLVLNNRQKIWELLKINPYEIIFENPYFQKASTTNKSCQIDYLIQTRFGSLYLCEIKFSKEEIQPSVIREVQEKIDRMQIPKYHSIRPVLIHVNGIKTSTIESDFFAHIIDFGQFLE